MDGADARLIASRFRIASRNEFSTTSVSVWNARASDATDTPASRNKCRRPSGVPISVLLVFSIAPHANLLATKSAASPKITEAAMIATTKPAATPAPAVSPATATEAPSPAAGMKIAPALVAQTSG